jgi:IclR family KDG regulon transcriptional repressor
MRPRTDRFPYRAQVVERTFKILDILASSVKDQDLAEIVQVSGIQKSTCYRLMRILERHHFAERDVDTGKYQPGSKLLELGARASARVNLAAVAGPFLEKLSRETRETAHLGILSDGEVVSIATSNGYHAVRMSVTIGRRSPVHCSSLGKSILAFLPEEKVDSVLRERGLKSYTKYTIGRRSELKVELKQVRAHGFAVDDQELEEGLKCIGSPVRDYSGKVVAALSIAGTALRFTKERVRAMAPLVVQTASDLSVCLGYRSDSLPAQAKQRGSLRNA